MRRFIPGSLVIILSGFMLFLLSCAAGSCFEETESYLKASLYTEVGATMKLQAPDSLTLYGLNQDSIIYYKKAGVQVALFPLNASAESSIFVIVINGVTDTLEFRYSSYPHLISRECGYTFYHHLDTTIPKHHAIKDIYTTNPTITTLNGENIRIFY